MAGEEIYDNMLMKFSWLVHPALCFPSSMETDVTHVWRCMSFLLDVVLIVLCLHDFAVLTRYGLRNAGAIAFALTAVK